MPSRGYKLHWCFFSSGISINDFYCVVQASERGPTFFALSSSESWLACLIVYLPQLSVKFFSSDIRPPTYLLFQAIHLWC
ncbi:hypothetical protein RB195_013500 [Necator americanus]|uniref:Uncharacterized protein n=1 Tax=Necator americanus TaxID=51031 RepID=A0ABR1DVW1_NECAM